MRHQSKYSAVGLAYTSLVLGALHGCFDADPRSIDGALDATARAIEADDGERLYRTLDQRSRHALESIVADRSRARGLIERYYPPDEQQTALAALGDAAQIRTAAQLFARRCASQCRRDLAQKLGASVEKKLQGEVWKVKTSRGHTLDMYAGSDGWYGFVWRTQELAAERTRAAQERKQIEANAEVYRRRDALMTEN